MIRYEIGKDEGVLVVVRPETIAETRTEYTLEYLRKQRLAILAALDSYIAARKTELSEVDAMIAEAEKLGIRDRESVDSDVLAGKVADVL